ncbi:MAG: hypothetical protein RR415_12845 [Ruthenibacterium sp.]
MKNFIQELFTTMVQQANALAEAIYTIVLVFGVVASLAIPAIRHGIPVPLVCCVWTLMCLIALSYVLEPYKNKDAGKMVYQAFHGVVSLTGKLGKTLCSVILVGIIISAEDAAIWGGIFAAYTLFNCRADIKKTLFPTPELAADATMEPNAKK